MNETRAKKARFALILAGGAGSRMGGADKGVLKLMGRPLIDHVAERLAPQTDRILISGRRDYATGFKALPDRADGPRGPAAALWSMLHWLNEYAPDSDGFITAPVDGPFLPPDLVERLSAEGTCAIARSRERTHPTFAYWRVRALRGELSKTRSGEGISLLALAESLSVRRVCFETENAFFNINTPGDLARAVRMRLS